MTISHGYPEPDRTPDNRSPDRPPAWWAPKHPQVMRHHFELSDRFYRITIDEPHQEIVIEMNGLTHVVHLSPSAADIRRTEQDADGKEE